MAGDLIPRRFKTKLDRVRAEGPRAGLHVELVIEVEDDRGAARCRELYVTPHEEDGTVTKQTLSKLPVDALVRYAIAALAMPLKTAPDGTLIQDFAQAAARGGAIIGVYERFARATRRPRSGSPLTDENLRKVATVYRAAVENGHPPTKTVAEAMHVARSTAARWVAKSRERGFLGPALGTRAGEAGKEN
jgi:hypothetical protein